MYKLRWQVETMFRGLKHKRRAVSLFKYGLDYIFQCLVNHTTAIESMFSNFCHILRTKVMQFFLKKRC